MSVLPSWRPGPTREAVLQFLDAAASLPVGDRVAAFDNDGTLWCEKPTYAQYDFFEEALRTAHAADPALHDRAEYAALLDGDRAAMAGIGLERIALALADLFVGEDPVEFATRVRDFLGRAQHRTLGMPLARTVYRPMLELIDELRKREFTVVVVTGGGTEFVRAVSGQLYGVPPEAVVGTLIEYDLVRDSGGAPRLERTARVHGVANEGAAKVSHLQSQLGRRPVLGAGNSGGDREMLEWAAAGEGPRLALLVDHDDPDREFRYVGSAETFTETEPITEVGERLGWTVVSMKDDWSQVFAD